MSLFYLEARITGRVQLVMMRDFIKRKARKLGIKGYVQNLKDGSVKIKAHGKKEALLALIKFAKGGSLLSNVQSVEYSLHEADDCIFKGKFFIKY